MRDELKQRLQKVIAEAGLASRRKAEDWIRNGRVQLNGEVATLGVSADPERDRITIDGKPLRRSERKYYLLLNKPVGYVTSLSDPQGRPVVTALLRDIPVRVYPVGRLDLTTEGLLLLTNDGSLAHRLMHPRHEIEKTYLVRAQGKISTEKLEKLTAGLVLDDGPTLPAKVDKVRFAGSHTWLELTIREGRNRQVRRMLEAIGHPVSRLKRVRLAFLDIENLPVGSYRLLSSREVERLKKI